MYLQKFKFVHSFILIGTLSCFFATPGLAQESPAQTNAAQTNVTQKVSEEEKMSASGLLTQAMQYLHDEFYSKAIPLLEEYVKRMESSDDERVQALLQEVRLKLAKVMIALETPDDAIPYLEQYVKHTPRYRWREAHKLLAMGLFDQAEYKRCIAAVTNGLAGPPPEEVKEKEKVDYSKLSEEELGGLTARQLKRYEKYAEEAEDADSLSKISDQAIVEPEYTTDELVQLNMLLADSYAELGEWEKSLEPYRYVLAHETNSDRRGYAIMQLVSALINMQEFEEATDLVMELYRTDARYNIRVNMALMSTASALFNENQFDAALPLYRMVLPRGELFDYQVKKMNEIRREAGLPDAAITITTNASGHVQTIIASEGGAQMELGVDKPEELIELENRVVVLMDLPPYETDVLFRMGQLYSAAGRPWEALLLLNRVYEKMPDSEQGKRAFYEIINVLIESMKDYDQAEKRGLAYLDTHKEGVTPRQIAYLLTGMYQQQEKMKKIKTLLPYIKGFVPADENLAPAEKLMISQYECELYYMQAVADLMMLNYKKAKEELEFVTATFPDSHQADNVAYWHAMTLLFLQDYQDAFNEFEAYPEKFPHGHWLDVVAFRAGICLFAMDNLSAAKERFTYVINTWPESTVFPDACSLRGDLLGADGYLDEALQDYRTAIKTARKPEQATYAVFQMASVFETLGEYDKIIQEVNAYLDKYQEDADIAKAMYWIGKTKLQQGLLDEAIDAYLSTILKYGGDVRQDGVDLILSELAQVASHKLEDDELAQLEERIQKAIDSSDSETLKLRLRVLLAQINRTEIELGKTLLSESIDLESAPPPVLAVICDASFAATNYSHGPEMLKIFQTRYEDSDYMRAAYKLCGFYYFTNGQYDDAMKIVKDAQSTYGTDSDMAWAQVMKGQLLLERGELDAALKDFRSVLNIRDWRGVPYAQATYYLGLVEEKLGNPLKAFGWYQRAYFQYKGLANGYWAAEAYLGSARCLKTLGRENDVRNTYRAMLFDPYVNNLPQAETARKALGAEESQGIREMLELGIQTNITVTVETELKEE